MISVGDLLADKKAPNIVGLVVEINEQHENPYKIICLGKMLECDLDYILKYCEVISENR
jgi:hypothetical protein